jgi:uncharacterized membrane protein YuzA (DUF378 family)
MMRSPFFYIVVGVAGTYAFHHWIKPLPAAKSSS